MDLEDRILRQNVPGRWSSLEGENDDLREDEDIDDDMSEEEENSTPLNEEQQLLEQARNLHDEDIPEPVRRSILAERARKHNTGVKGVLADYKQHNQVEAAVREREREFRENVLTRMAQGSTVQDISLEQQEEEEEDVVFMESFRKRRLLELQMEASLPIFGTCREVDSSDFTDMVDNEDPRVHVVVHIYESSLSLCLRLNKQLEEIAVRRPHVKFLRMNASANALSIDLIALPILTVYKGGEREREKTFAITQELGEAFTVDDVDGFLEEQGIGVAISRKGEREGEEREREKDRNISISRISMLSDSSWGEIEED
eukprot:CAMPEP_0182429320 /NCGR_PEP_ID=MMETSP1167-20130531/25685_1 /TAXON_ID=2988 /ORGANISM="Mallomonas Sp, Strain CCMP3275" /LENGTH=315 /DNA_ID=CAMNT_0024612767 /DNA_START=183 /DNA_END=1130 /DNA_ORIENTATION=+